MRDSREVERTKRQQASRHSWRNLCFTFCKTVIKMSPPEPRAWESCKIPMVNEDCFGCCESNPKRMSQAMCQFSAGEWVRACWTVKCAGRTPSTGLHGGEVALRRDP